MPFPSVPGRRALILALLAMAVGPAWARPSPDEVVISGAWVRATAPGQPVAAGYADFKAAERMDIVGVESPVAGKGAELHEMKMDGGVMKMRAVPKITLPKGQTVRLAPGGIHVMLFGVGRTLSPGDTVPITFVFQRKGGQLTRQTVDVPVREASHAGGGHEGHEGHEGHHKH